MDRISSKQSGKGKQHSDDDFIQKYNASNNQHTITDLSLLNSKYNE